MAVNRFPRLCRLDKGENMISNVLGRVQNTHLPKSQALLPLYEAIINSIDAIEDIKPTNSGTITIKILRQTPLPFKEQSESEARKQVSIDGFEVIDDGIGFVDTHYDAFNEADTRIKAKSGGKGVGRFTWLKTFKKVEIESVFRNEGEILRREFIFSLNSPDGISNHTVSPAATHEQQETKIRFLNPYPEYQNGFPKNLNTIALRIVQHCLAYFVLGQMPKIVLVDGDYESLDLDGVYEQLVASSTQTQIDIGGIKFDVVHFMLHHQSDLVHSISYCANQRLVTTKHISGKLPNLPASLSLPHKDGAYVYTGYISSEYLDKRVNQQRTGFDYFPEDGLVLPGELTWPEIENTSMATVSEFLKDFTEVVRVEKEERISNYVADQAPQYRYILKNHPEHLDTIAPDISDDKLDAKLYSISKQIETELKEKAEIILESTGFSSDQSVLEEQLEDFSKWWEEYNEVGKSTLAKYIVHRKRILTILEKALQIQDLGNYSREEVIHRIIFPLRKTSDDIAYDQHNLWVLDEKLSYHQYLASDIPLRKNAKLENESSSRPDLLLFFNRAIAMVDDEPPFNSGIVIFEFKRPMRDDYTSDENPVQQVLKYVQEIRDGNAKTKAGRPFEVPPRVPFYCYIVCDLTKELRWQAQSSGLRSMPDNLGFFGYNEPIGAYIEVIGFDKLLSDANKRNRILFEKLNLPTKFKGKT